MKGDGNIWEVVHVRVNQAVVSVKVWQRVVDVVVTPCGESLVLPSDSDGPLRHVPAVVGPNGEEEIAPYATFHLLGFREEMDPAGEAPPGCQTMGPRPAQNGRQMAPQVRTLVRRRDARCSLSIFSVCGETEKF